MSLSSLRFSDWWEDLEHPHRLLDQDFGLGLHPDQLPSPFVTPARRLEWFAEPVGKPAYRRAWSELLPSNQSGTSTVQADKDKFQVVLDVHQFDPNEIDVKVADKFVVVTAKHEEKRDEHGWVSRQFVRKYLIPEQCDIEQASSKLSSDGVLTIAVPRKDQPKLENERVIKIEHTGKPAIQQQSKLAKQQKKQSEEKQEEKK